MAARRPFSLAAWIWRAFVWRPRWFTSLGCTLVIYGEDCPLGLLPYNCCRVFANSSCCPKQYLTLQAGGSHAKSRVCSANTVMGQKEPICNLVLLYPAMLCFVGGGWWGLAGMAAHTAAFCSGVRLPGPAPLTAAS